MPNSNDVPEIRQTSWVNIPLHSIRPGRGHIGIDLTMGAGYLPCKNTVDEPHIAACAMAGGYSHYYMFRDNKIFDGANNQQPSGLFFSNEYVNAQGANIHHDWAKKVNRVDVEIYPWDESGDFAGRYNEFGEGLVGAARFDVEQWGNPGEPGNPGLFSAEVGDIELPRYELGAALLNGQVYRNGRHAHEYDMKMHLFHLGPTHPSSTGFPIHGFASVNTNKDGFYKSGPVYPGNYKLYVIDPTNPPNDENLILVIESTGIFIHGERLDFEVETGKKPRNIPVH